MLNLVIAEAALELVPREIEKHPSIRNDARRREVPASAILLDRSLHHHAMLKLSEDAKRGRPDLVHLTLLSITSTPLYQQGKVNLYIHTQQDLVLKLQPGTRPPKSYSRFRDLAQKLLAERPESGLISVSESSLPALVKHLDGNPVIGLSTQGRPTSLEKLAALISESKNPMVLIGGFPKGHFAPETVAVIDQLVRIHPDPLDAHVVAARLVYEVELATQKEASDYQN